MSDLRPPPTASLQAVLTRGDVLLIVVLGLLAFGPAMFNGKPLSMHEARLPQLVREMADEGRWLLPHSGGRPWLERPPLPHVVSRATGLLTGVDTVWAARLPTVLAATGVLLLGAWSASRLFGRAVGLLTAGVLATCYEFNLYAQQAEDDIFLALVVAGAWAAFIKAEVDTPPREFENPLGRRPWPVVLFFALAGLTAWAKGPGVGAVQLAASAGVWTLIDAVARRDARRVLRYLWLPGWLLFAVLIVAWPVYAYRAYPSGWDNLAYDFTGPFGHQPFWYYGPQLLLALAPWTPVAFVGILWAWRRWGAGDRRVGALLAFAVVPVLVMSVPSRKHHHYLLPVLLPWATLAAVAVVAYGSTWVARQKADDLYTAMRVALVAAVAAVALLLAVPVVDVTVGDTRATAAVLLGAAIAAWLAVVSPAGARRAGPTVAGATLVLLACVFTLAHWGHYRQDWRRNHDADFAREVSRDMPRGEPLFVVAEGGLEFFKMQFYAGTATRPPRPTPLLHNVTFLRDASLPPQLTVLARDHDEAYLRGHVGDVERLATLPRARDGDDPGARWVLYRLHRDPSRGHDGPVPTADVMQGMERRPGPFLGPPHPHAAAMHVADESGATMAP